MQIETKALADLIPADYNPRVISDQALAGLEASIKRFGLVEPVVWNRQTGRVVGGHQRLKVLAKQGITETEVIVVDLPESEEKALNVTLNNPHIAGTFTPELQTMLDEIKIEIGDLDFGNLKLDELYIGEAEYPQMESGEPEYRTMTFTVNNEQFEIINQALSKAKKGEIPDTGNENSNGNALYIIASYYHG